MGIWKVLSKMGAYGINMSEDWADAMNAGHFDIVLPLFLGRYAEPGVDNVISYFHI